MNTKILISALIVLLWGCNDFLRESSQDEVRPSTVEDMEQILLGDGYINEQYNFYYATEIFTDNMQSYGVASYTMQADHNEQKYAYTWDKKMFTESGSGYNPNYWQAPYEGILGCNLVLDYIDDKHGSDQLRESIRGEALVLRSWYYLHLVNFFGIAYNQGDPGKNLGVPLKLRTAVTGEFFLRNTVKEVYSQIEKDLLEGNRLLTEYDYKRNFFRIGHLAAKAILSRVYLYMEDWDKALAYADSVLQVKPDLMDLNTLNWKVNMVYTKGGVYQPETPAEIIWSRLTTSPAFRFSSYNMTSTPFALSNSLDGAYEGGSHAEWLSKTTRDLRAWSYFAWRNYYMSVIPPPSGWYRAFVQKNSWDNISYQGIRTAEMYLNRAEAYIQKYIKEGNDSFRQAALADLNKLRRSRYNAEIGYTDLNITDGQELLQFCINERRRELVGETNHRWCDLRRYGITVSHTLVEDAMTEYTQDMTHYVLPIPEENMRLNPYLVQN